jgi:hypothetical protein
MPTTTRNRPPSGTDQDNKQNQMPEMTLSEAASIMRDDNATPEERSKAASVMGREGGKHSHDRDARSRSKVSQSEEQEA